MSALMTTVLQAASVCGKNAAYVGSTLAHPASCSDPNWLDTGDNAWQLTAATLVGLMSIPGLAALYAGLVPKIRESAGKGKELGITKEGSRLLRIG